MRIVKYDPQKVTVKAIAMTTVDALDEHVHGRDPGPLALVYVNHTPK